MTPLSRRLLLAAAAAAMASPTLAQPTPPAADPPAAPDKAAADKAAPDKPAPDKPASDKPSPDKPAAAPAAAGARIPAPPAGKGQVVFFRPRRIGGMAVSFTVYEGTTYVGHLTNGTYVVQVADPGPHAYNTVGEAKDTINVEVEAGETIYLEQTIGVGLINARPHLNPSTQAAFDKLNPDSMRPAKGLND